MTKPVTDERIVAAAIYYGAIVSLPPPARHHTIIAAMDLSMGIEGTGAIPQLQGFLTNTGRYVGRVEAYYIAIRAGQIKDKPTPELYSEDMW